jgi:hypothetical protein
MLSAARFDERADDLQSRVGVIRKVLVTQEPILSKQSDAISDAVTT